MVRIFLLTFLSTTITTLHSDSIAQGYNMTSTSISLVSSVLGTRLDEPCVYLKTHISHNFAALRLVCGCLVLEAFDSSHLRRNSEFVGTSISQNLFYPAIHPVDDLQAFRLSSSPPAALTTREFIDSSTTTMTNDHDKPTELHCRAQASLISPPLTPLARIFSPPTREFVDGFTRTTTPALPRA